MLSNTYFCFYSNSFRLKKKNKRKKNKKQLKPEIWADGVRPRQPAPQFSSRCLICTVDFPVMVMVNQPQFDLQAHPSWLEMDCRNHSGVSLNIQKTKAAFKNAAFGPSAQAGSRVYVSGTRQLSKNGKYQETPTHCSTGSPHHVRSAKG